MKTIKIVIFILTIGFIGFRYFGTYKNALFLSDEYWFTMRAPFFELLFVDHDVTNPRWFDADSQEDASQPKLGPYLYGLTLRMAGINDIDTYFASIGYKTTRVMNRFWWEYYFNKPLLSNDVSMTPIISVIWKARVTAIVFSLIALSALYYVSFKIGGTFLSLITTFVFYNNTLTKMHSQAATTDMMQLCFFLLSVVVCYFWVKVYSKRWFWGLCVLMGIILSLAFSVKTSGLLTLLLFCCMAGFQLAVILRKRKSIKRLLVGFGLTLTLSAVIFYSLHPFIYQNTPIMLWKMYVERTDGYKHYWGKYPSAALFNGKLVIQHITTNTLSSDGLYTNFSNHFIPIDLVLTVSGIILLLIRINAQKSKGKFLMEKVFLSWSVIVFVGLLLYLRNDWPKYFLPLASCFAVLQAYSIYRFGYFVVGKFTSGLSK